jgi:hypothetical protein
LFEVERVYGRLVLTFAYSVEELLLVLSSLEMVGRRWIAIMGEKRGF